MKRIEDRSVDRMLMTAEASGTQQRIGSGSSVDRVSGIRLEGPVLDGHLAKAALEQQMR